MLCCVIYVPGEVPSQKHSAEETRRGGAREPRAKRFQLTLPRPTTDYITPVLYQDL